MSRLEPVMFIKKVPIIIIIIIIIIIKIMFREPRLFLLNPNFEGV